MHQEHRNRSVNRGAVVPAAAVAFSASLTIASTVVPFVCLVLYRSALFTGNVGACFVCLFAMFRSVCLLRSVVRLPGFHVRDRHLRRFVVALTF